MNRPAERFDLGDAVLRRVRVSDAQHMARAVAESLEHLRPFMPWADAASADPVFQRDRLRAVANQWERGEEYQYALFDPGETRILGAIGLMTRRGKGSLEIGYWIHAAETGKGLATRATAALTDAAFGVRGVKKVLVYCDEANERSAAIPRRLGFALVRVDETAPTAPGECGRQQVWLRDRPLPHGQ